MELSDMERQFLPPHGINSLAPVVSILGGIKGRKHPQQVVTARAGTEQEEQPRSLKVVKCGDVLEESGVGLAGLLELGLDEVGVSYGGPTDGEALFCGGQSGVADPNVGA